MDVFYFFIFLSCLVGSLEAEKVIKRFPKNKAPSPGTQTRLFGATPAEDNQFPYAIFVLIKKDQITSCSASLVKANKVLLAAHCVEGNVAPSNVIMVAGKPDLAQYMAFRLNNDFSRSANERELGIQERRAQTITISDGFTNPDTLEHDLAVITVEKPFELSSSVQLIPISTDEITERKKCTILGWGLTEDQKMSPILLFSNSASVVPLENCAHKTSGPFVCLLKGRSGICQGDSGSPLVCDGKVYGVASHVLTKPSESDCGHDSEEIYAELHGDEQWVNSMLADVPVESKTENTPGFTGGAKNLIACQLIINVIVLLCLAKLL